jgi:hypothetical protein
MAAAVRRALARGSPQASSGRGKPARAQDPPSERPDRSTCSTTRPHAAGRLPLRPRPGVLRVGDRGGNSTSHPQRPGGTAQPAARSSSGLDHLPLQRSVRCVGVRCVGPLALSARSSVRCAAHSSLCRRRVRYVSTFLVALACSSPTSRSFRRAPCAVRCALCAVRRAPCAVCRVPCAVCRALCAVRCVPCAVRCALCAVRCVPCAVCRAPCAVRYALCAMRCGSARAVQGPARFSMRVMSARPWLRQRGFRYVRTFRYAPFSLCQQAAS